MGIDVRKLGDGGIGEYVRETVLALREVAPALAITAFGYEPLRSLLPDPGIEWVTVTAGKYSLAEHVELPAALRRHRVDVFHAPHYVLPLLLGRTPAVVTVHDVIHVAVPRSAARALYARFMITAACRRARRVIAVSETTARDLEARFGVPREKLRVVPNGVSPRFRPLAEAEIEPVLRRHGLRRPYVLFVGNQLPHKNVEGLIRAWARLEAPRPDLVLCGRGHESAAAVRAAVAEARSAGAPRLESGDGGAVRSESGDGGTVRFVAPADPADLVALYGGAELLATASRYEGFGLPVVEAFACGTPVVASDAGALPEIAGDAALFAPPHRVDLLAERMYRLLRDRELRRELVTKGLERARRFDWRESARKTLSVYEEVSTTR